ncbi:MAG: S8 family serine peptidase, partial [Cyanobacteria bacterium]|nr:S8 family serine peptidase [Cyanobacteriota bacterium]
SKLKLFSPRLFYKLQKDSSINYLKKSKADVEVETLYEVDIDKEDQIKQLAKAKFGHELNELKKAIRFNILMKRSTAARTYLVKTDLDDCSDLENYAQKLFRDKKIENISLNNIMQTRSISTGSPNDPEFSNQWYLNNIGAPHAWSRTTGVGVKIGVIDLGLEFYHPDVQSNINIIDIFDSDNDTGFVRFTDTSHGTLVTGLIAAEADNNIGITGIAPNSSISFASNYHQNQDSDDKQRLSNSQVVQAVNYLVRTKNVSVINMSFGYYRNGQPTNITTDALYQTLVNAVRSGVVIVFAAGNEDVNVIGHTGNVVHPIAGTLCSGSSANPCFDYFSAIPGLISVAAIDQNNKRAFFSNYGNRIDIAAPGTNILSTSFTYNQNSATFDYIYESASGTSFSSPIVAASAGLLLSIKGDLSPAQVRTLLVDSSEPLTTEINKPIARRLNIGAAVDRLESLMDLQTPRINNLNFNNGQLTASWSTVTGAERYEYRILKPADGPVAPGASPYINYRNYAPVTTNRIENLNINDYDNYFFAVRACNELLCSDDSEMSAFEHRELVPLPAEIVETGPRGTLANSNLRPTLTWRADANAVKYQVQLEAVRVVNGQRTFEIITTVNDIQANSWQPGSNLVPGTQYRFFVTGYNSQNQAGPRQSANSWFRTADLVSQN